MKIAPLIVATVFSLIPATGFSAALEDIRALLHAGDVDGIETTLSQMAEARDQDTIDLYREVSDTLFRTSHPVALKTLENWLEQEPRSSAALAANAWAAIHDHFLKSSPYGFNFEQPKRPLEYVPRWSESRETAIRLAQKARRAGRYDVSAIDAWLLTQRFKFEKDGIARAASDLLNLSANRASVRNIVAAMVVGGPNSGRAAIEGCWTYGDRAEDYSKELCLIEAAMGYGVEQDLRDEAEKLLEQTDDPRLDWARLEVAIWEMPMPDVEVIRQLQMATLDRRYNPLTFDNYAQRVEIMTEDPDYLREMRKVHLEYLDAWLADDPYNHRYLRHKSAAHLERGELGKAKRAFLDGLRYGWNDQCIWFAGAAIAIEQRNLEMLTVNLENAAATVGQSHGLISAYYLMDTALSREGMTYPSEDAQCLHLRLARMVTGLCSAHGSQFSSVCRSGHPMSVSMQATIDTKTQHCPKIAEAALSDLPFSPLIPRDTATRLVESEVVE